MQRCGSHSIRRLTIRRAPTSLALPCATRDALPSDSCSLASVILDDALSCDSRIVSVRSLPVDQASSPSHFPSPLPIATLTHARRRHRRSQILQPSWPLHHPIPPPRSPRSSICHATLSTSLSVSCHRLQCISRASAWPTHSHALSQQPIRLRSSRWRRCMEAAAATRTHPLVQSGERDCGRQRSTRPSATRA